MAPVRYRISTTTKFLMLIFAVFIDVVQLIFNLFAVGLVINFIFLSLPANTFLLFWFSLNGVNYIFPRKQNISESKAIKRLIKIITRINWKPLLELLPFIPFLDTIPWTTWGVWSTIKASREDDEAIQLNRPAVSPPDPYPQPPFQTQV